MNFKGCLTGGQERSTLPDVPQYVEIRAPLYFEACVSALVNWGLLFWLFIGASTAHALRTASTCSDAENTNFLIIICNLTDNPSTSYLEHETGNLLVTTCSVYYPVCFKCHVQTSSPLQIDRTIEVYHIQASLITLGNTSFWRTAMCTKHWNIIFIHSY